MLLWEPIIETSDTTMVTTEWAMYELAKDPMRQVYVILISLHLNYLWISILHMCITASS